MSNTFDFEELGGNHPGIPDSSRPARRSAPLSTAELEFRELWASRQWPQWAAESREEWAEARARRELADASQPPPRRRRG